MLTLVHERKAKTAAQTTLRQNLKNTLEREGKKKIGFPGGNTDEVIFSAGAGKLWASFTRTTQDRSSQRYWNAFGVYNPDRSAQIITVEINIPIATNSANVAGFFAEDRQTGDIYLMHSGRIGGGRPGVGKAAFLVRSKAKLVEVEGEDRKIRSGIVVGRIANADLADRIWRFVRSVDDFKTNATNGSLSTPEFKRRVDEFERYNREFSGNKNGTHRGHFEYLSYHGDIVEELYRQ